MKRTFSLGGGAEPECWAAQRQSIESLAWIDGQFTDRHLGVWFLLRGRRIGAPDDTAFALGRNQLEDCPQSQSHERNVRE